MGVRGGRGGGGGGLYIRLFSVLPKTYKELYRKFVRALPVKTTILYLVQVCALPVTAEAGQPEFSESVPCLGVPF